MPKRVRGLVLLNPTHPYVGDLRLEPGFVRESWYQQLHLLPIAEELLDGDADRVAAYLGHFYEHWAGDVRIGPAELAAVVAAYARPGRFAASIGWYRARTGSSVSPPPVPLPTIALWGDRDPMRPLSHRAGFARAFPRSTSTVLPGVGHFVAAEAPAAVAAAIRHLLVLTN